jgi:hypothetical protein
LRNVKLGTVFLCGIAFASIAACSGGSSSIDATNVDGGPGGGSSGSSGGSALPGVCGGLVSCGAECTVLDEDAKHCGACGNACPAGQPCVAGVCRTDTCEAVFRKTCGTLCVYTAENPDNCGACSTRCGAKQTCFKSACVDVFGTGTSCADPIVMPGGGSNVEVGFTFDGATQSQVLTCGDPTARPIKTFRFTANKTKSDAKFEIQGGLATNDLVLEVFGDAACDKASAIGCNDDEHAGEGRPELRIPIETGKTYFIVVSSKGPPPAGRFYMKFDD